MLAVSPLTSCSNNEQRETEMEVGFSMDFPGLANFDAIDLDDLFIGMDDAGHDLLPDLEMDPEIDLAEFSVSAASCQDKSEVMTMNLSSSSLASVSASDLGSGSPSLTTQAEETASNDKEPPEKQKGRKLSFKSKNPSGRKKVKVDWTPELHKRFVQAVEQLGVDKAVPSRILEIMGITCLTRHNIASHLQKYRSHQKHRMAREAEVASWSQSQGREVYRAKPSGQVPWMRDINPWIAAPTVGFPPVTPMTHYRPLHVWGHPSLLHMWPPPPNASSPVQPHTLGPPPAHPSIWHSQSHHHRFPSIQLVPGVPTPQEMYKVDTNQFGPRVVPSGQILPQPPSDAHPSKESVDAAIGDVLSKPWLPLPLGLKPPSTDSVMVALQRQGISKIPPTCARLS